ncbi:hypothetical protein TNCT_4321 [Trichonephila clavata]|uniref:Uncharacterized protein n=1 Tax=Trichonephila clavata TaxID=2740835 RepID=A0A8X6G1Y3_TRICU|nr:hypothetical protein TNCT_4321 [Trichonephila clavata]
MRPFPLAERSPSPKVATQVLPNCSLNSYKVDSKVSLVSELTALGLSYEPLRSSKVATLGGWRGRGGRALPLIRTDDMKMVQCAGCERPSWTDICAASWTDLGTPSVSCAASASAHSRKSASPEKENSTAETTSSSK